MPVEDVFSLNQGRLVMLTGRVERGRVRTGDEVESVGFEGGGTAHVVGIDAQRVRVGEAGAGMNAGLLLHGAEAGEAERGQVLAAPGSIAAHTVFAADIALLSEEEGAAEVRTGGSLAFYVRAAAVRGVVTLPHGMDALRPLHTATVTVALERPVALEESQPFAFRQHGRAAGSGTVTRLLRQFPGVSR
ncbi:hypothetical protein ADL21_30850 [Streptomyces albus subsp. albus]|nr:hypothetical protein ADL21_30850 [Streptomyces albus subsp. albus]